MSFRFSARTGWDVGESSFAAAIREARLSGRRLYDLTISNPTVCGFSYDAAAILAPLGDSSSLIYDPDARGMRSAREAVAGYYREHGAVVDPDALVLTTSTSEGYGYLFRLLCDAGDEVLVAQPSYPLFDFLADLEDVKLRPYPLFYDYGWWIDFAELELKIGPRTRAIVVVHPNNPTGHGTKGVERRRLEEICARHGLALIVDEVFLDYSLRRSDTEELVSFAGGAHPGLTFVLSGMSKIGGLPQMKAAWIAGFGPEAVRQEAMGRLEVIADTFLSMNAPVQGALPSWLEGRQGIQQQILERVRTNLACAEEAGLEVLRLEAGWCAILRLPRSVDVAGELFEECGVIVHPGSFYGIAEAGRVVISLIGPVEDFADGIEQIADAMGGTK
ncbi:MULTISPECIES: pyridoxal phosphate-dependent aminotransferase [Acidobacteriaceae]|uniref:pyridoxal phosphate-dependent aminotransferase n=1 Tax=Acidobacteriaceae TaxID=204434 RepID=UPI00131D9EDB|nr:MULTISPECIES: pyridoxal phosphate-dependent aminotransferase [Acidobacteriaceae]MDW5266611.1 pyridoxal phosphate-dependent aminotransferase [Edaphobacter sp.]